VILTIFSLLKVHIKCFFLQIFRLELGLFLKPAEVTVFHFSCLNSLSFIIQINVREQTLTHFEKFT